MNKTSMQFWLSAQKANAEKYHTFLEMVNDPINPITKRDLLKNIERNPKLWECFSGWLKDGKLKD